MNLSTQLNIENNTIEISSTNKEDFQKFKSESDYILGMTMFQTSKEYLLVDIEQFLFLKDNIEEFEFLIDEELQRIIDDINKNKEYIINRKEIKKFNEEENNILLSQLKKSNFNNSELPLKPHQLENIYTMSKNINSANFSVPGSGKTSVAIAVNSLFDFESTIVFVPNLVVAEDAWISELQIRLGEEILNKVHLLKGGFHNIDKQLNDVKDSGGYGFITYSQIISEGVAGTIKNYMLDNKTHLILDESHRIKGAIRENPANESKQGRKVLELSFYASRRDILTGTPMPQDIYDLASQAEFLYPFCNFKEELTPENITPGLTIKGLWTRTTKSNLSEELPPQNMNPTKEVPMNKYQALLYELVVNQLRTEYLKMKNFNNFDDLRRAVKRLIKITVDPHGLSKDLLEDRDRFARRLRNSDESKILQMVIDEGEISTKMEAVIDQAKQLISDGEQVVIWTQFVSCVEKIAKELAKETGVFWKEHTLYGATDEKSKNITKKKNIDNFNKPEETKHSVLVAIAKTGGEGLSLHYNCKNAIYLDRDYNAREYLQSLDRIHRLGMNLDNPVNYYFFESVHKQFSKTIERRISENLQRKIEYMGEVLDDEDLRILSLDEESLDETEDALTNSEISDLLISCFDL